MLQRSQRVGVVEPRETNNKPETNQEQREEIGELQTGEEEIQEGIRSKSGSNSEGDSEGAAEPVIYRIAGKLIDPEIQQKLYAALDAEGIAYWYEGALAQMMQESQGNPTVVNPENQEDMGLFQYKVRYWDWAEGDIFDADVQMRRYAREMAARFNAGLSVDECISRHNTSDSVTEVNWKYVADVKQWLGQMEVCE